MPATDLVRTSRDGDQFHYHWAARQCLALLRPGSELRAVSIEGASPAEFDAADGDRPGDQVIDIAEYFGSERLVEATHVVYRQLKHSTVRVDSEWTMSALKKTFAGFGAKFTSVKSVDPQLSAKLRFEFVSNRPVNAKVRQAIADVATRSTSPGSEYQVKELERHLGLNAADASAFCRQFSIDDQAPSLVPLMYAYESDLSGFLPGSAPDASLRLKELVTQRATSRLQSSPVIRVEEVLSALYAAPHDLQPAPPRFAPPRKTFPRLQYEDIAKQINDASNPVVVHAAGGVGKSVLASHFDGYLPEGSVCVSYDCFGLGGYRRSSEPRHGHREGYVQLANELAGRRLCDPLVPSPMATTTDYSKAFVSRMRVAAELVATAQNGALLVLVIDAADNAVMAAREAAAGRAFVLDLLLEALPSNVRLVMLCRTERRDLLEAPPGTTFIELRSFEIAETRSHLATKFDDVSDEDSAEFHKRTSANPRVQDAVICESVDIKACLALLGENVLTVDSTLDRVLEKAVTQVRHGHGAPASDVDSICVALAALRPRIPIQVISDLCRIDPSAVRSFVTDLGRPLMFDDDVLQFRDEPTETWFRDKFRLNGKSLIDFLGQLEHLADSSPYVAASLPQMLWEAKRFDQLVQLALSGTALPIANELERAEIEHQRLQFALKAALRADLKSEAAQLALKAGVTAAGGSRRRRLIKRNTDLAGLFLATQSVEDLVATRALRDDWFGANLAYEACMLSATEDRRADARSRLRSAISWISGWTRLPAELRDDRSISDADIGELALGTMNTDGPIACAEHLATWRPPEVSFNAGLILAQRLLDQGRLVELDALAVAAENNIHLLLAIASRAARTNHVLGPAAAKVLIRKLKRFRKKVDTKGGRYSEREFDLVFAIIGAVTSGCRNGVLDHENARRILDLYIPESSRHDFGSQYGPNPEALLKAMALREFVGGLEMAELNLAPEKVAAEIQKPTHQRTRELAGFRSNVMPLVPWVRAWAEATCTATFDSTKTFNALAEESFKSHISDYETPYAFLQACARIATQLLVLHPNQGSRRQLVDWLRIASPYLSRTTLTNVVQISAPAAAMDTVAFTVASWVAQEIGAAREEADSRCDALLDLSRAIYVLSPSSASEYFDMAVDMADKIGDDVMDQWFAMLSVARASSAGDQTDDERAYRVAQVVEAFDPYIGDGIDYEETIRVITQLSPNSAIAIASRWRDRNFGRLPQTARGLFSGEQSATSTLPVTAVALLPLADTIALRGLLASAVRSGAVDRMKLVAIIAEFDRANPHSDSFYKELDELASAYDLDLTGTPYGSEVRATSVPESRNADLTSRRWSLGAEASARRSKNSLARLRALDFGSADGMESARLLQANDRTGIRSEDLWNAAFNSPPGRWHEIVAAFGANPHFSSYDYQEFFERLSELEVVPQGAQSAARDLVIAALKRFCSDVATRRWEVFSMPMLTRLSGTAESALFDVALLELGSRSDPIDAASCFALAGNLVRRIPVAQAREVLDQSVNQIDYLIGPEVADGPWQVKLKPPTDLNACIAGYLWAGLGDPDVDTRWRSTHAVKLLCELAQNQVLDALLVLAEGADNRQFNDSRLIFYQMNALDHLLLALERASLSAPQSTRRFERLLRDVVLNKEPHAGMRESAKQTLVHLCQSGEVSLDAQTTAALARVNVPTGEVIALGDYERPHSDERDEITSTGDFHFGFDFARYWCKPLAECFGLSASEVEQRASEVITKTWRLANRGKHEEDARHTFGLYGERRKHMYKDDRSPVDDLDDYLAKHALMVVAGELIATRQTYREPELRGDDFSRWLRRERPTRRDGRWLADRKDSVPPDQRSMHDQETDHENWRFLIKSGDFAELLTPGQAGQICVFQESSQTLDRACESISIRSAFVTPNRAKALVVALQTAESWISFKIPEAEDSLEIERTPYELVGWIDSDAREPRVDGPDPFADGILFPPPRPTPAVIEALGLISDDDMRVWWRGQESTPALASVAWSDTSDTGRGRATGMEGRRLTIEQTVLRALLREQKKSLILKVTIGREQYDYSGRRVGSDEEGLRYLDRSYKIFVIDEQGGAFEL